MQEIMHGDRRLRTLFQPCQHPFLLHGDGGRRLQGIIRAEHFTIPAITRRAGIGGHNPVERPFVTAPSCQSKSYHVCRLSSLVEMYASVRIRARDSVCLTTSVPRGPIMLSSFFAPRGIA